MERKWSMREFREGDEEEILELSKAVNPQRGYDREQWLKWWHWMYKENPAGAPTIRLAEHEHKIVGQYAVVPVTLKIDSETTTAAQSVDTMTHPDYRRQGMFETLAREVYRDAGRNGIHLVYGLPNKASYLGFIKKLNWFDIARRQIVFKPLNWENAMRLRVSHRLLARCGALGGSVLSQVFYRAKKNVMPGLTIRPVSFFDERIDHFWNKVSSRYKIMVVRNRRYLNWRYCAVPNIGYTIYIAEKGNEISGYIVLRCMQEEHTRTGVIFDILAESAQISRCLISKAVEHCRQEKVDMIYGLMIADRMLIRAFRDNGFISFPFLKDGPFILYSSSPYVSKQFLSDPRNWFSQIGDSDYL